jgi:isoaspartyl peptidase/L-asparaginase-like protein (Ntn-hydrolase superfamily)
MREKYEKQLLKRTEKVVDFQDTIGGIIIDEQSMILATSSGGPWLKDSGRIGSVNFIILNERL